MRTAIFAAAMSVPWLLTPDHAARAGSSCHIRADQKTSFILRGRLTFHIYPGTPNFEDVRKGDAPEPAYILRLDASECATGTSEGTTEPFDRVQLFEDRSAMSLRRFAGQHVTVIASGGDVGMTGHDHAPFSASVVRIEPDATGTPDEGFPAISSVRAFYAALAQGDGAEAAHFVVPSKRASGPMSANAMTRFYGTLASPLKVQDVRPLDQQSFEVSYTYRAGSGPACDGRAVVVTVSMGDLNFISSIRSLTGC